MQFEGGTGKRLVDTLMERRKKKRKGRGREKKKKRREERVIGILAAIKLAKNRPFRITVLACE